MPDKEPKDDDLRAEREYRRARQAAVTKAMGRMWFWDTLAMQAAETAADLVTLQASGPDAVAWAYVRSILMAE